MRANLSATTHYEFRSVSSYHATAVMKKSPAFRFLLPRLVFVTTLGLSGLGDAARSAE